MTAADPAARLQALADWLRDNPSRDFPGVALAEHVEGVAKRHKPNPGDGNEACWTCSDAWPCPDLAGLLAVADAAGVTP